MRRFFSLLLCCVIVASSFLTPASAAESRASSIFARYNATVQKNNSGDLDVTVTIYAAKQMDCLGATEVKLQREINGRWISVATFTPDTDPDLMSNSAIVFQSTVTYETPISQSNYRAYVTIYGCSGSNSDSISIYSNELTYR